MITELKLETKKPFPLRFVAGIASPFCEMPEENSNPVKREKIEEEDDDDKSIASAFANKKKTPNSSSNIPAKSQPKVKKELNKVKNEEPVEDFEEPSSKKTPNKVQKKKVKEEVVVKKTKKGGKENETKDVNKREKKVYDLPGQKRDPPQERDPLRIFYETLYRQVPTSEMAAIWMMESGLLPKDEARKVFERKQKKSQQQRLSSPMKTVVNVKKKEDSVAIKKKSSATPVSSSQKKKKAAENKTEQTKKRKIKSEDDNDDFVADTVKAKKQRAS